ncbi:MAG TPA: hypothetical protein VFW87_23470, partial [Pirellulales bacterium]|nr:hypothetical protein [Pirellulales bacterium]
MSKSDDEAIETMLGCLAVIFRFALMPVTAILRGWVLSILWAWFIASQFGLPTLGIAQAIGIALTVGMFAPRGKCPDKDERAVYERMIEAIVWSTLAPPLA